jgi:hypothetical protein
VDARRFAPWCACLATAGCPLGQEAPIAELAGDDAAEDTGDSGSPEDSGGDSGASSTGQWRLVDPLDEPEGYCADIPGHLDTLRLDDPMQAHTCKSVDDTCDAMDDQVFTADAPFPGMIYAVFHDRCVGAPEVVSGGDIFFLACDVASSGQGWSLDAEGRIHAAADDSLCWAVATGAEGDVAGGESNLRRPMALRTCGSIDAAYTTWQVPGDRLGG